MNWKPKTLTREHVGNAGESRAIFRELAVEAHALLAKSYEDRYGEDFCLSDIKLESDKEYHMYYKKDEKDPFFFMSRTEAERKVDPLTGEPIGHVSIECRIAVDEEVTDA